MSMKTCNSVMASYLEDDKRGADLIIAFGAKQGITQSRGSDCFR